MDLKQLCVVVTTHGAFDYAEAAIDSLFRCTHSVLPHVLVVDDASPDWDPSWITRLQEKYKRVTHSRFSRRGGLLRSWNHGAVAAAGFDYTAIVNSDVLFTPSWEVPLVRALENGYDLVGPVTNAPGTEQQQYVGNFSKRYVQMRDTKQRLDDPKNLNAISEELASTTTTVIFGNLNGFFLMAKSKTWVSHNHPSGFPFSPRNERNSRGIANPTPDMTLGEYELQQRWHAAGLKSGFVANSYIFHYRAVSRGVKFRRGDWLRRTKTTKTQ